MTTDKMINRPKSRLLPTPPLVVGTVHSPGSLRAAARLQPGEVDLVELRADAFAEDPRPLLALARGMKIPCIVTVRHPAEGGAGGLKSARRGALYREFLPVAACLDVELRSVGALEGVIAAARESGVRVIVSTHDFHGTPSVAALRRKIAAARSAGADGCKIATFTRTAADLGRLVALFAGRPVLPLSVMGMGPLGKVSRLVLARLGSELNYGYLDRPNASGQWEARELKRRLAELAEE